jgi:hypothetical protein
LHRWALLVARSIYMLVGEARLDLDTSEMFEGYLLKSDDLEGDHVIISFARRLAFLRTRSPFLCLAFHLCHRFQPESRHYSGTIRGYSVEIYKVILLSRPPFSSELYIALFISHRTYLIPSICHPPFSQTDTVTTMPARPPTPTSHPALPRTPSFAQIKPFRSSTLIPEATACPFPS